jgi:hypothetical protein
MSIEYGEYCVKNKVDPKDKSKVKEYRMENREWGPGYTQKDLKYETDINQLLKRHGYDQVTKGLIKNVNRAEPMFLDVTPEGLKKARETFENVNTEFHKLEPETRMAFRNDPMNYLAFLNDPGKAEDMVKTLMKDVEVKAGKKRSEDINEAIREAVREREIAEAVEKAMPSAKKGPEGSGDTGTA